MTQPDFTAAVSYKGGMGSDVFELTFTDDNLHLEECEFSAGWTEETFPAEPYSYGATRGDETEYSATIYSITLGELMLKRDDLHRLIGNAALSDIEDQAAELVAEAEAGR